MTLSITPLSIKGVFVTLGITDNQQNNTDIMLSDIMMSDIMLIVFMLSDIMLSDIMLTVVTPFFFVTDETF